MATIKKLSDLSEISGYDFRINNIPENDDIFQISILSGSTYRSAKIDYNDFRNAISDPILELFINADEQYYGFTRFATTTQVTEGSGGFLSISPEKLKEQTDAIKATITPVTPSTEYELGVVQLASSIESIDGTNPNKVITPKTLNDVINYATDGLSGMVELATDAEATAGTLTDVVINPKQLIDNIDLKIADIPDTPSSTTIVEGLVELATLTEVCNGTTTGTSGPLVVTPNTLIDLVSYAHFTETQSENVSSDTLLLTLDWVDRGLNTTEHNTIPSCSIDTVTGIITLPSGSYRIEGCAKIGNSSSSVKHCLKFVNIPDTDDTVIGMPIEETNGSLSIINGEFKITTVKTFKLQHYSSIDITGGDELDITGVPEIYADLRIFKINTI